MSRRFSCPSFDLAISSSWIISAVTGAKQFFLPKYSPDLNPIEQVFAKLKHLLRKAAARTVDAVCAAIGHALEAFSADECANYLRNSGYQT
jgi:transposase